MKYTVSLLLLVAIGHAAEPSRSKQDEDDNKTAKRELLEGNYGLRIQSSVLENAIQSKEPQLDHSRGSTQQENVPSKDYGPPRVPQQEHVPPLAKISDLLTGQGPSFPAAIASHLYSPVSVYQPRLGSPTTFEIARPVTSQLYYLEHKIFNDHFLQDFQQNQDFQSLKQQQPQSSTNFQQQDYDRQILKNTNQNFNPVLSDQALIFTQGQSYEGQENLIRSFEPEKNSHVLKQNAETTKQSNAEQAQQNQQLQNFNPAKLSQSEQQQQQSLQQNVPASTELRPPRPDITESLIPRLETFQPQTRPNYSEQIIQQIFPQDEEFPSDFFQQINQLENQLPHNEEAVQYTQNPLGEQEDREAEKKENEKSGQLNANQSRQQTSTERQASTSQAQSSTSAPNQNTKPQATSYARFSQGLQTPSNQPPLIQGPPQPILLQPQPSPSPLPQFLQLPQAQTLQPFQPVPQLAVVQPIQQITSHSQLQPLSLQPLFQPLPTQPTVDRLIAVARFQPLFTVSNQSPKRVGIIRIRQGTNQRFQNQPALTNRPQNQPLLTTRPQNQTPLTTRSQNQQTISNRQPQTQVVISENFQPTFAPQELNSLSNEVPTVSTTFPPRSTSESSSTESSTPVSIVPKAKTRPTLAPSPNSPPQELFTSTLAPPTLPPQPVTEAPLSIVLTSIQPLSTLAPVSQPQPTLAPLHTSKPQLIQLSTQPQILPSLQSVQVSTSLQPLATLQPIPVTQQPQQETPGTRAIPVQHFQIQSEPLIQVQPIEQQQPVLPVQIQHQSTPLPSPQQLQNKIQLQSKQQEFRSQAEQQQQSQIQFAQEQKHQLQSEKQQNSQTTQQQQLSQTVQPQENKEAAITHAQELLYDLYSPYLQTVYSGSQEILIQQPHFNAASLAFPSSYSPSFPSFQATPAFSSTQYFGNYAQDIFGGPHSHHHHSKKK